MCDVLWIAMHNLLMFLSLQEIVRGGITVSATFNYRLTPELRIAACYINAPITVDTCCAVYDEWPDNRIGIDTWYQIRSIRWCRSSWGISYVSLYMYKRKSLAAMPIGFNSSMIGAERHISLIMLKKDSCGCGH